MMPITFEGSNKVLKKPSSMADEDCMDLPVHAGKYPDGSPCIISCWKLNKEDLEEIQKTGVVWLSVFGYGMPPVSLFTENPFE